MCLPETMTVYDALETFKTSNAHSALVYDEYGTFQGIITLRDILDGLIGNITHDGDGPMIVKRPDTEEWLIDGQCPIYDFLAYFDCEGFIQTGHIFHYRRTYPGASAQGTFRRRYDNMAFLPHRSSRHGPCAHRQSCRIAHLRFRECQQLI